MKSFFYTFKQILHIYRHKNACKCNCQCNQLHIIVFRNFEKSFILLSLYIYIYSAFEEMEEDFQIFFSFGEHFIYIYIYYICTLLEVVGQAFRLVYCEFNAYNTRRFCSIYIQIFGM